MPLATGKHSTDPAHAGLCVADAESMRSVTGKGNQTKKAGKEEMNHFLCSEERITKSKKVYKK